MGYELPPARRGLRCLSDEGCKGTGTYKGNPCTCETGQTMNYCLDTGFFDSGRGEEQHTCRKKPKHDGDHGMGQLSDGTWAVTWR